MKRFRRVLALTIVMLFIMSTSVLAAIPSKTVITSTGKAYALGIVDTNADAQMSILDAIKNGEVYVKLTDDAIVDLDGNPVDKSDIPEVVYTDGNVTERYAAGDGDKITDETSETPIVITNKDALLADSEAGNLLADGKTVMKVKVAILGSDGDVDSDVTGLVEFVSKYGLTSAQKEVALDKGTATFNVTLPNSKKDIEDEIKVRVKSSSNEELVGVESEPIKLTYSAYDPSSGIEGKVYTVDSVKSADVADRVVVYVAGVQNAHLDALKEAIVDQVKIVVKTEDGEEDINLLKVVDESVISETSISADYAFTVLLDLEDGYLIDNQYNYYYVNNQTKDITTEDGTPISLAVLERVDKEEFMLIDKFAPAIEKVKVSNDDKTYLGTYTILAVFNEAVSTSAEVPGNWVINGQRLTESDVYNIRVLDVVESDPDNTDLELRKYLSYTAVQEEDDERNCVVIELKPSAAKRLLFNGINVIQVKSVTDWAGMTDLSDNNKITTQDFEFNYKQVEAEPELGIIMESPEQFILTLNEPLYKDEDAETELVLNNDEITVELILDETPERKIVVNRDKEGNDEYRLVRLDDTSYTYILELTKDWTQIIPEKENADEEDTYHSKEFKVTINDAYDVYGERYFNDTVNNKDNRITASVVIPEDTTSPQIASYTMIGVEKGTTEYTETPGCMKITMSEPVQLVKRVKRYGDTDGIESLVLPEVTPSVQQEEGEGVPVPTFEYVKQSYDKDAGDDYKVGDKVDGEIFDTPVDEHDTKFYVKPKLPLENGEWKLVVRSISDDVGNTMKTEQIEFTVNVESKKDNIVDPYVIWAFADDDNADGHDYVYILFSRRMEPDVLRAATYDVNGKQVGQDAHITSEYVVLYRQNEDPNDENYDEYYDRNNKSEYMGQLITIQLPGDFIVGGDDLDGGSKHNVLTLPTTLKAVDDGIDDTVETLLFDNNGGSNQFELSFDGYDYLQINEKQVPAFIDDAADYRHVSDVLDLIRGEDEDTDTTAPVINYDGESTIYIENGTEFVVPDVTATDDVDGDVEVTYVIKDADGNTVEKEEIDTTVAATYTITYSAVDAAGNEAATLTITVIVLSEDEFRVISVGTYDPILGYINFEVTDSSKISDVNVGRLYKNPDDATKIRVYYLYEKPETIVFTLTDGSEYEVEIE